MNFVECTNGYRAHPTSCSKYIVCDDSNTVMNCPGGLHYNPKSKII